MSTAVPDAKWFTMHVPTVSRTRLCLREDEQPFELQRLEDPGPLPDGLQPLNDWKRHAFYAVYEEVSKHHRERITGFLESGEFQPVVARIRQQVERSHALIRILRAIMR